jgi:myo-inositol-1-phosphate synthase
VTARNGSSNGNRPHDGKVRVAIVGVGNCASSLVQGVHYYRDASETEEVPGLMHVNLGGYHVRDIEFVAAIDIDKVKVGKDLSEAIFSGQNNTIKFADVPRTGIKVARGMTHDGLGKYLSQVIEKAPGKTDDIVGLLRDTRADVLVSPARNTGAAASRRPACRSSATTSRARSARRSSTACSPACSTTAASRSSARTS